MKAILYAIVAFALIGAPLFWVLSLVFEGQALLYFFGVIGFGGIAVLAEIFNGFRKD